MKKTNLRIEKRKAKRITLARPMRVRSSGLAEHEFEDAPISINSSTEGLYFTTQQWGYYAGLNLLVTFPFVAPGDPMNCDYVARVARVEKLANGRFGIGVQLLINLTAGKAAHSLAANEHEDQESEGASEPGGLTMTRRGLPR